MPGQMKGPEIAADWSIFVVRAVLRHGRFSGEVSRAAKAAGNAARSVKHALVPIAELTQALAEAARLDRCAGSAPKFAA